MKIEGKINKEILVDLVKKSQTKPVKIYKVYWLKNSAKKWIKELILNKTIIYEDRYTKGLFIKNSINRDLNESLMDAGIIPNTYNNHQTFITKEYAEKYILNNKDRCNPEEKYNVPNG